MPEPKIALSYVGPGFYAGVPARDMTSEEVEMYGGVKELTKDGYYAVSGLSQTRTSSKTITPAPEKDGE
jgi:hypothetical protein